MLSLNLMYDERLLIPKNSCPKHIENCVYLVSNLSLILYEKNFFLI